MHTETFEQSTAFLKNFANPFNDWTKVSTDFWRQLATQNADMIGENFNRLTEQTKRLSSIRKPEDILNLQKDCWQEDMQATVSQMQKMLLLYMDNLEQWSKYCSRSTQDVVNKTTESMQRTRDMVHDKERDKNKDKDKYTK